MPDLRRLSVCSTALCTLAVLLAPASARACSVAVPGAFSLDAAAPDTAGPTFDPAEIEFRITRGTGPDCDCEGECSFSSCDDLGFISLLFDAATDPDVPEQPDSEYLQTQEDIGYVFEVVGDLPDGLSIGAAPQAAWYLDGRASTLFVWIDGSEDDQEAFDFDLSIRAVDRAGNYSDAVVVTLADPGASADDPDCGDDGGGCHAAAGTGTRSLGMLLLGMLLLGLRQRR